MARVAEAAPNDDAASAVADRAARIEEAAAKAVAAAERIDGGLATTEDRVAAEIGAAATRIKEELTAMRAHVTQHTRLVHEILGDILTQTAGPRFGWKTVLAVVTIFVLGMLLESQAHLLYRWL